MPETPCPKPFIRTPKTTEILNLFDKLRDKRNRFGVATCALVTGESGSGKSALAERYFEKHPPVQEDTRLHIPVLHIDISEVSTVKAVLTVAHELLISHGGSITESIYKDQINSRSTAADILNVFSKLAIAVGVELIIFDEVQTVHQGARDVDMVNGTARVFKDLIKKTEIPIVFMGMPWSKYLIDSNIQLTERITYRKEVDQFKIREEKDENEYRMGLKLLGNEFGFPAHVDLADEEFARRMFAYSKGNMRRTVNLIKDVWIEARTDDVQVEIEDFGKLLYSQKNIPESENPFLIPMEKLKISEILKPSDFLLGVKGKKDPVVLPEYIEYEIGDDNRLKAVACG